MSGPLQGSRASPLLHANSGGACLGASTRVRYVALWLRRCPVATGGGERAEATIALREARRGLVIHGLFAMISVVVHAFLILRVRKTVERRQAKIEREVIERRQAA